MRNMIGVTIALVALTALLVGVPIEAATINVACPGQSIQAAVDTALPGDVINVTGTCAENVLIRNEKQRITIAGGPAVINAGAGNPAFNVRGKGILIQGFTINGGTVGVEVNRGSNAVINGNTIQNSTSAGILADQVVFVVITNNTIQNSTGDGIVVSGSSHARIGFNQTSDVAASPNTIQNNANRGIVVTRIGSARIAGNTIQNNGSDGIGVFRNSQADIAFNTINGNGGGSAGNGVAVGENASVQLGEDSPAGFLGQPEYDGAGGAQRQCWHPLHRR